MTRNGKLKVYRRQLVEQVHPDKNGDYFATRNVYEKRAPDGSIYHVAACGDWDLQYSPVSQEYDGTWYMEYEHEEYMYPKRFQTRFEDMSIDEVVEYGTKRGWLPRHPVVRASDVPREATTLVHELGHAAAAVVSGGIAKSITSKLRNRRGTSGQMTHGREREGSDTVITMAGPIAVHALGLRVGANGDAERIAETYTSYRPADWMAPLTKDETDRAMAHIRSIGIDRYIEYTDAGWAMQTATLAACFVEAETIINALLPDLLALACKLYYDGIKWVKNDRMIAVNAFIHNRWETHRPGLTKLSEPDTI